MGRAVRGRSGRYLGSRRRLIRGWYSRRRGWTPLDPSKAGVRPPLGTRSEAGSRGVRRRLAAVKEEWGRGLAPQAAAGVVAPHASGALRSRRGARGLRSGLWVRTKPLGKSRATTADCLVAARAHSRAARAHSRGRPAAARCCCRLGATSERADLGLRRTTHRAVPAPALPPSGSELAAARRPGSHCRALAAGAEVGSGGKPDGPDASSRSKAPAPLTTPNRQKDGGQSGKAAARQLYHHLLRVSPLGQAPAVGIGRIIARKSTRIQHER
eukprot:scaffold2199_cov274-Prasinococcus_capsulatus_cf.AAC.1